MSGEDRGKGGGGEREREDGRGGVTWAVFAAVQRQAEHRWEVCCFFSEAVNVKQKWQSSSPTLQKHPTCNW